MKYLLKLALILVLGFALITCEQKKESEPKENTLDLNQEFISVTMGILEELSKHYPKEDVKMILSEKAKGHLTAKYKLVGETKERVGLGSFAAPAAKIAQVSPEEGTTCDGVYSCGSAIKDCFERGMDALISVGACYSDEYCVTCQAPK